MAVLLSMVVARWWRSRSDRYQGFVWQSFHRIDLTKIFTCANGLFDDLGRKDDLAAKPATAEDAAFNEVINLLTIDPELAGQFGNGQIAPLGTFELGEQIWRLVPQDLDNGISLPARLAA